MSRATLSLQLALRSVLALLAVALTTLCLWLLRDLIISPVVALLYLLPVVASTLLWGLLPGVVAAVGAFLLFNFYFIPPYFTFAVHQTQDVLALAVFLSVAVVISQLLARSQAAALAATAREHEATRLYELSTALAGQQDHNAIARTLAAHTRRTFQADYVQLSIHTHREPLVLRQPDQSPVPSGPPLPPVPLQTARGALGELQLWRDPLSPEADRLLRTFASQGALALERAQLLEADTRARVLEESDRLKTALLRSVSHELRSPLAAIKAGVSSLRGGEVRWDSPAGADLLGVIEEEVDHLNRLVGNLLDMSRIEAGALNPQRQWNVLADIVGSTLTRLRLPLAAHRVELDLPDDLPLVPVDALQLDQVFTNLLSNSLKYAPPNSTIHIAARVSADQHLQVDVGNQGPPVDAEHLDRIFDKFYRVTAADRVTGTGLGLSICKGIIEAHGGRIWAENVIDGLAFKFQLPLTWDGTPPPSVPPALLKDADP